ncbi:MAG: endonuclease/exonuclease/phosphatase family protein [Chloroflexota bacterium]
MRVMTFNVRGSFHDDGDNDWHKRRELNIATIKKYDPDIIGFQEANKEMLMIMRLRSSVTIKN